MNAARKTHWPDARYTSIDFLDEVAPCLFHSSFAIENYDMCDRIDLYALVQPGRQAFFIDVGFWEVCGTGMLDQLMARNCVTWENARAFITHFHDDHAGNADYCRQRGIGGVFHAPRIHFNLPLLQTFVIQAGWVKKAADIDLASSVLEGLWDNDYPFAFKGIETHPGQIFSVAGYALEVLSTPGHAPDHQSLIDRKRGILFGGDHVHAGGPGVMQFQADDTLMADCMASLRRLKEMSLNIVYASHGDPIVGNEAICLLIDENLQRLAASAEKREALVARLAANKAAGDSCLEGATVWEVTRAASKDSDAFPHQSVRRQARAVASTFAFLEWSHQEGRLVRIADSDGSLLYRPC